MPDLNFDNEDARNAFKDIAKFWFWIDKGVSGFRLDAVKHIYLKQKKSVEFLEWFADYCKSVNMDVYIVAEVWS